MVAAAGVWLLMNRQAVYRQPVPKLEQLELNQQPTADQPSTDYQSPPANDMPKSLPEPATTGQTALESAIEQRRSVRDFSKQPLSLQQLGQLLWSAQGITDEQTGFRAAPSAGALYPLTIYAAVGNVEALEAGIYQYQVETHALKLVAEQDQRPEITSAAVQQQFINEASVVILIAADFDITAAKYGGRAEQYVYLEAGHAAQNILLQTTALGLGAVPVGAFDDNSLQQIFRLTDQDPLYLIVVGTKD